MTPEHMADVIIQHNAKQKNLIQEPETELLLIRC